jgi:hypothetical protein
VLTFTAPHEIWLAGEKFDAGLNTIEKPSAELVKHAGSAHAAGVIEVTDGLDASHVQSQSAGETALRAAQGTWNAAESRWSGPWHEGNLIAHAEMQEAVAAAGALGAVSISIDVEPEPES